MMSLSFEDREKLLTEYSDISEPELNRIWEGASKPIDPNHFRFMVSRIHRKNFQLKNFGKVALSAKPMFQLLQVHVYTIGKRKPLSVFGNIYNESGFHYKRGVENIENLGVEGGLLSLISIFSSADLFLSSRSLSIDLSGDQFQNPISGDVVLEFSVDGFEEVKKQKIVQDGVCLDLSYVAIPMAVLCYLNFNICKRHSDGNTSEFIEVYGTISARYKGTYGNYNSEEIVIFQKNLNQPKRVTINDVNCNILESRRLIAVPVYCLLEVSVNLSSNGAQILCERAVLEIVGGQFSTQRFEVGGYSFCLDACWVSPLPESPKIDYSQTSRVVEELPAQEDSWILRPHMDIGGSSPMDIQGSSLVSSSGVEVFSIYFNSEKLKEGFFGGCIQYVSEGDDYREHISPIVDLDEEIHLKSIGNRFRLPFLGSKLLRQDSGFKVTIDLRESKSSLVKGFFRYFADALDIDSSDLHDKFLCAVINGEKGFISFHYSILAAAYKAKVTVTYNKLAESKENLLPVVFGYMFASYGQFEYSSPHHDDSYAIELFGKKDEQEPATVVDGQIPLSRSEFLVPVYSGVFIDVNIQIGRDTFKETQLVFNMGSHTELLKNEESELRVQVDWSNF